MPLKYGMDAIGPWHAPLTCATALVEGDIGNTERQQAQTASGSGIVRTRSCSMRSHIYSRAVSRIRRQISTMSETVDGPIALRIREKLLAAFAPVHLDVRNESFMHNVPKGAETHFKVVVVSPQFDGKPLLQRHRMVNAALADELASGVHALSIVGKTPAQWETSSGAVAASPNCLGGMKNDPTKQAFLESLANEELKKTQQD